MSRGFLCVFCFLCVVFVRVAPAEAQQPARVSIRLFGDAAAQRFFASQSFEAIFGGSVQPFVGGGVQVTFDDRYFVEFGASRFSKTGDQVFVATGQVYHLGIPLTATVTPLEFAAGYRFHPRLARYLVPYAGAGIGWYRYEQTSAFADPSEDIDTRKPGFLVAGGVEFRVHRWVGLAVDAEYTHVPGILGTDPSVSHEFGETDLGGIAARFRIIVGR
jgi:opacity protein-like surface antigen